MIIRCVFWGVVCGEGGPRGEGMGIDDDDGGYRLA